ncbi:MAG: hypothetical protein ACREVI_14775 [Steroidobacteraceae bacterium]
MRLFSNIIFPMALACSCLPVVEAAVAASERGTDTTAFYEVPMMCPAARGVGCGSVAKPVLLALEKASAVEEAWLDHKGQVLAVIWMSCSAAGDRAATLAAITEEHGVSMGELSGPARQTALQSFLASKGWHRGAEVDRLSEEEAHVVADRFLVRLITTVPTARSKVESLRPIVTDATRHLLVETDLSDVSRSEYREKLLAAARQHLNERELSALRDAIALGLRPVGDEH